VGKKLGLAVTIGIVGALYVWLYDMAGQEHQGLVLFFSLVTVLVLGRGRGERRAMS
jgi:hypothetical protein